MKKTMIMEEYAAATKSHLLLPYLYIASGKWRLLTAWSKPEGASMFCSDPRLFCVFPGFVGMYVTTNCCYYSKYKPSKLNLDIYAYIHGSLHARSKDHKFSDAARLQQHRTSNVYLRTKLGQCFQSGGLQKMRFKTNLKSSWEFEQYSYVQVGGNSKRTRHLDGWKTLFEAVRFFT